MRRVFGLLAVIGLVAAISPATVAAARPIRDSPSVTILRCDDGLATDAGFVGLYAEVFGEGSFVSLSLSMSGDPGAMPDIFTDSWTATFDGSRFNATAELVFVDESQNPEEPPIITPAGSASLEATLTADGDLQDLSDERERIGNTWERQGEVLQVFAVEGTLSIELLDGTQARTEISGCTAATTIRTVFLTNPNAFIMEGQQRFIECSWATEGGFVELAAVSGFGVDRSHLFVKDGDRELLGLNNGLDYGETAFADSYVLLDMATREVSGDATVQAALAPSGDRVDDREWVENMRFSLVGDVMTVDGSLTVIVDGATTVLAMDDTACDATDLRIKVIERL